MQSDSVMNPQLTDVGDAVVSETMGGGELVSPSKGEDEGIALVCS